jgi:RNA polymerase sigma factor for flagellar operon FliA
MLYEEIILPRGCGPHEALAPSHRAEMQKWLTNAILLLPERERLVFTLYYYEEFTIREIELLLGETRNSVSKIYSSALLHLHLEAVLTRGY